jgi:ABC-type branched-subunit amino acid transport system ATPase component
MLRCEHIFKSFDGVHAVSDVSVHLDMLGVVGLIGPNGAGKTTLFNILTGFLRADSGRVWFGQTEITRLPPYRIAQLGICRSFQDLRLIRRLSVLENVLLAQPNRSGESLTGAILQAGLTRDESLRRSDAMRLLCQLDLESAANELAGEVSYGQQKLLTIACCLATGARVLLFDEPVAGVHPHVVNRILDFLRYLGSREHFIVFIEHDLAAVRKIADQVVVMDEGRVMADGKPCEVLQRPEIINAYVT